jgi:hypothetical protein
MWLVPPHPAWHIFPLGTRLRRSAQCRNSVNSNHSKDIYPIPIAPSTLHLASVTVSRKNLRRRFASIFDGPLLLRLQQHAHKTGIFLSSSSSSFPDSQSSFPIQPSGVLRMEEHCLPLRCLTVSAAVYETRALSELTSGVFRSQPQRRQWTTPTNTPFAMVRSKAQFMGRTAYCRLQQ